MKKWIVLITAVCLTAPVMAADWVYLGEAANKSYKIYGDAQSRTASRAWVETRYNKPQKLTIKNSFYLLSRDLMEVDCLQTTFKPLSLVWYNKSGSVIHRDNSYGAPEHIIPGTATEAIYDFICKHEPR